MSCLLIKNDGIGDLILSSGLISVLAKHYGTLDLVTCETNREIAELIPGVRRCFYMSRDSLAFRKWPLRFGIRMMGPVKSIDSHLLKLISSQRYNVAITLRRYIRLSTLLVMNKTVAKKKYCCWLFPTNCKISLAEEFTRGWDHYRGPLEVLSELEYFKLFIESKLGIVSSCFPRLSKL